MDSVEYFTKRLTECYETLSAADDEQLQESALSKTLEQTSSDTDYEQPQKRPLDERLADLHECSSGIRFYFEAADKKILAVEQSLQRSQVTTEAWISLRLRDNYRLGWSDVDGPWGLYLSHQDPEDPDPVLPIAQASEFLRFRSALALDDLLERILYHAGELEDYLLMASQGGLELQCPHSERSPDER